MSRCVQNDFRAYGTFGANRAPIFCQDEYNLKIDENKLPLEIHYLGVPFECAQSDFHTRVTFDVNRAPIFCQD